MAARHREREDEQGQEKVSGQIRSKRKYTRKVTISRLDIDEVDVGSSSSSSSGIYNNVKSPIRHAQGQITPESPDHHRRDRESNEAAPRFERNADG
ncbi:hypothetical protein BGX26_007494, partial [Mortierella sp. AD094]